MKSGYSTPYHDLLAELRRRELAVLEQQARVDRFVMDMIQQTNLTSREKSKAEKPSQNAKPYSNPKRSRNQGVFVPNFLVDALNRLPIDTELLPPEYKNGRQH